MAISDGKQETVACSATDTNVNLLHLQQFEVSTHKTTSTLWCCEIKVYYFEEKVNVMITVDEL